MSQGDSWTKNPKSQTSTSQDADRLLDASNGKKRRLDLKISDRLDLLDARRTSSPSYERNTLGSPLSSFRKSPKKQAKEFQSVKNQKWTDSPTRLKDQTQQVYKQHPIHVERYFQDEKFYQDCMSILKKRKIQKLTEQPKDSQAGEVDQLDPRLKQHLGRELPTYTMDYEGNLIYQRTDRPPMAHDARVRFQLEQIKRLKRISHLKKVTKKAEKNQNIAQPPNR